MRFNLCLLATLWCTSALADPASAPTSMTPVSPAAAALMKPTPAPAAAPVAATSQPGAGIIPLSEAARPVTEPTPKIGALQPDAKAIVVLDGNGKPIDDARSAKRPRPLPDFMLMRLSFRDGERHAMLWVKGVTRPVHVGSHVLKQVVSEIREDGLCLDPVKGKHKCARFLTFDSGNE